MDVITTNNGTILGFTKAVVLCYAKAGKGDQIAYNIRTKFGEILNQIDFTVDRYILDNQLTKNWVVNEDSTDGGNWYPSPALTTTFDLATDPTTFDQNSLRFVKPVDNYEVTDRHNKYIAFPKTNILK